MSTHNFVLIGEAGSGKTEIAANLALRLAEDMPVPVCLLLLLYSLFYSE